MSKINHDNNIGFGGFEAYSDEFAINIPEHDDSTEASQKTSSESEEKTNSTIYEAPAKRTKAGGIWWVIIIGVIGGLWLLGESDNKPRSSSYSPSSSYSGSNTNSYSEPSYSEETLPPIGTNNVLNSSQIRYCLSEKIRMDAVETAINTYSQAEIDYFNNSVADYNSRCGSFKYRQGALSSVERSVNANISVLRTEGINKLKAWRLKKNTNPAPIESQSSSVTFDDLIPTQPEPKLKDIDPVEEKNLAIELETGLKLVKVDGNGKVLPWETSYEYGNKILLKLNGKTIADLTEDVSAVYAKFANHWKIDGAHVVQLETGNGGNACGSEQRLLVVANSRLVLSQDFGNCSPPKISSDSNKITFTFFVGYGERLVATYKDSKLTQANVKLSTKYNPASNQPGYAYLAKEKDLESILLDDKLNGTLTQLMGNDFQNLKDRMLLYSGVTVENGYLVISGGMPHSFGTNEGYLAIGLNESVVYAAVLEGEYLDQLKKFIYHLRAYSTESASVPPPSMNKWMAQFKEATPTWKYEK